MREWGHAHYRSRKFADVQIGRCAALISAAFLSVALKVFRTLVRCKCMITTGGAQITSQRADHDRAAEGAHQILSQSRFLGFDGEADFPGLGALVDELDGQLLRRSGHTWIAVVVAGAIAVGEGGGLLVDGPTVLEVASDAGYSRRNWRGRIAEVENARVAVADVLNDHLSAGCDRVQTDRGAAGKFQIPGEGDALFPIGTVESAQGETSFARGTRSGAGITGAITATAFPRARILACAIAGLTRLDDVVATGGRGAGAVDPAQARAAIGVGAITVFTPFADAVSTDSIPVGKFGCGDLVFART